MRTGKIAGYFSNTCLLEGYRIPPTMITPLSNTTYRNSKPSVLVFDSGVGGLSVASEIRERIPGLSLIYASDNGFFPYGTKGEAELIARVDKVINTLVARYPVDILVIACNTASTLTLPHLRSRLSLPIVGVVPAIKPAAMATQSGVIGLLATPATVARPYTHELIREYATDCEVISLGSSELVQLAERKVSGEIIHKEDIAKAMEQLWRHDSASSMDVLVLACTHFPLLKKELRECLPSRVQLIDSGEAIARRVEYLLGTLTPVDIENKMKTRDGGIAVFTQKTPEVLRLKPALEMSGFIQIDFVTP